MVATTFDMHFFYILSGWEGSASDGGVFHDAYVHDLEIPDGKYYLADAGYPICDALLVPLWCSVLLQVSALHYFIGSWVLEGFWTVASAHALHQPTIAGLSISIISIHKFRIQLEWSIA